MNYFIVLVIFSFLLTLYKFYFHKFTSSRNLTSEGPNASSTITFLYVNKLLWCIAISFVCIISKNILCVWLSDFTSFVLIDQQQNSECDNKVQKHVTFSEDDNNSNKENSAAETVRNFFMMESSTPEQKPNFMVGGDLEEIEEKDEFPPPLGITKQISDAALIDKRRRLR